MEKNDINSFITNENLVLADWLLSQAIGEIQLQVFDVDVEDAIKILRKNHGNDDVFLADDIRAADYRLNPMCARCGSHHIFQIEKLGGIFDTCWYFLGFPVEISRTYYYCYHCDGEFTC
ncbi:hypothetical protein [Chryseobacterium sp. S90]|uniref:hypothetical protein n=1 Tax=Chryseobacterium sp. S90 TaxID=3395373 RepID=UPI0039BC5D23